MFNGSVNTRYYFNIKTICPGIKTSIINMRWSWDRVIYNGNFYTGNDGIFIWRQPPSLDSFLAVAFSHDDWKASRGVIATQSTNLLATKCRNIIHNTCFKQITVNTDLTFYNPPKKRLVLKDWVRFNDAGTIFRISTLLVKIMMMFGHWQMILAHV